MKKRLLSALLALALVFVLLPTTALAGETTYSDSEITISGKYWNFGNKGTSGEYAPVYFRSNGTAFQESKPTGSNYLEIKKTGEKEITITVYGTVNLTENESSTNSCISVNSNGVKERNLIITGAAKGSTLNLTCKNNSHPLYSYEGSITINGGVTVNATSQCSNNNNYVSVYGIQVYNSGHNLTISGANTKVNVANKTYDSTVKVDGNITVSDGAQLKAENKSGKVTGYTSKKAYAIECGQLSISGDKTQVTAYTGQGKKAINGTVNNGTENDDYKLTFKAGMYKGDSFFNYPKSMSEALGYAYVEITQAPTDPYVLIAGEQAIIGQETPIPGGTGTYRYVDAGTKGSILTLKDATINKTSNNDTNAIKFTDAGTYTVNLEGTNKISNVSTGISAASANPNFTGNINVILSGSGSLDISARGRAIEVPSGNLTFNNTGTINLKTANTASSSINAIKVSEDISVGSDFNKNLKITTDNGDFMLGVSDLKSLNECKTITIAPKPSETYYNNKAMGYGETRYVGNGTISCDENGVITLNGVTEGTLEFRSSADSTLVLEGTNTLSSIVTTQKGLTISGSGSLTAGSIRVPNNTQNTANLTIIGGAHVTVNRPSSEDKPAVEVSGNLTVTGDGTQLSAECTAATNPAIEVGGNVTISGNPGTNAYTVKAYNKYDTPRDRVEGLRPSQMPSAFEISGNLSISGSAQVMAQTDSDGAAVWMPKEKVISVVDASLIAQNRSHNFSTISFGDENNMGNIYAKGQVNIVAENMLGSNSRLAHKAIKAYIYNHYSTGDSNPYYINVVSEGVHSGGNVNVIPGHHTSTGDYKVTITRGDAYTTPQVAANYTIAGQTMYVGKYYKTDVNGNITDGTAQDYNIFCDSANDFTLNNATISSTGTGGSTGVIKTNLNYSSAPFHIKLIGTNSINNAGHHAILGEGENSTIFIENAENASNASLTISGNFLPVYSFGNVTINAEVVIINTNGNLISTNKDGHAGAFDLDSGYKCYASTSVSGSPLETYDAAKSSTYKYLCVTTKTLETGGGSTHQHVWDEAWHDTGDYHHAHQCTICKAYDTTTQESHNVTGHRDNHDGSHSNICGSCGYSAKVSHSYTWTPNANDNEKHIGTCVCGNVVEKYHRFVGDVCSDCGYDKSTGTTCEHVWTTEWTIDTVDNEYHWHKCIKCNAITDKKPHAYTIVTDSGTNHIRECECKVFYVEDHISSDWIIDTPATATTAGSMHKECTVCKHKMQTEVIPATGEIEPPTPDNPGTIVIIRPAEEEKPAQQPNPSTGANDLVGLAVAAAVAAALGSAALLRKHD